MIQIWSRLGANKLSMWHIFCRITNMGQMERMMISRRTKEALAARKAEGVQLGKPKGTIQNSIYDKDRARIVDLLQTRVSARKISDLHLGYGTPSSLNYYIQTRKLR